MTIPAAAYPEVRIANELLSVRLYLPDLKNGFYRGTRFDWSGVICSLQYRSHEYYGPWYTKRVPSVRDFIYDGPDIIAGAQSAITGPAEEFSQPQRYDTAKAGETFVKVGVGVLRKPDDTPYSCYNDYEIVDPGTWSIRTNTSSVVFEQEVRDPLSGCGYLYQKTIAIPQGRPDLVIEHRLRNTGRVPIVADQYNHNFLTLGRSEIGADLVIVLPFHVQVNPKPDSRLIEVRDNRIRFVGPLQDQDTVSFPIVGFGNEPSDYDIRVEDRQTGAGLRIVGNHALAKLALWSIRSVVSIEPFVDVSTEPGDISTWTTIYTHYTLES